MFRTPTTIGAILEGDFTQDCEEVKLQVGSVKATFSKQEAINYGFSSMGRGYFTRKVNPHTQKATGIHSLTNMLGDSLVPPAVLLQCDFDVAVVCEEWDAFSEHLSGTIFARPCPVRPRHGFVDSHEVDTPTELHQLWQEAREADPEAEVLLMPKIKADFNLVITPGLTSIGRGHDGATSGTNTISLPIHFSPREYYMRDAKIGPEDAPYYEGLYAINHDRYRDNEHARGFIVQLRGGPKTESASPDFIPRDIVVDRVICAEGDLLEWEGLMKKPRTPGTVVYHPGGTPLSHYSIHARLNDIPVITTFVPSMGSKIAAQRATTEGFNPAGVREGILKALAYLPQAGEQRNWNTSLHYLTYVLQNSPAMVGDFSFNLGAAAMLLAAFGASSAVGEARHFDKKRISWDREEVYANILSSYTDYRQQLGKAARIFATHEHARGYGGQKWYSCAVSALKLERALGKVLANPTVGNVKVMALEANICLNMAHNGGWWLNKFVNQSAMDQAAQGNPVGIPMLAKAAYDIARINPIEATLKPLQRVPKPNYSHPFPQMHRDTNKPMAKAELDYVVHKSVSVTNYKVKPVAKKTATAVFDLPKVLGAQVKTQFDAYSLHIQIEVEKPPDALFNEDDHMHPLLQPSGELKYYYSVDKKIGQDLWTKLTAEMYNYELTGLMTKSLNGGGSSYIPMQVTTKKHGEKRAAEIRLFGHLLIRVMYVSQTA